MLCTVVLRPTGMCDVSFLQYQVRPVVTKRSMDDDGDVGIVALIIGRVGFFVQGLSPLRSVGLTRMPFFWTGDEPSAFRFTSCLETLRRFGLLPFGIPKSLRRTCHVKGSGWG
jgi:hypothetical protein